MSSGTWLLNVLEEHSRSIFTGHQKVVVVVGQTKFSVPTNQCTRSLTRKTTVSSLNI